MIKPRFAHAYEKLTGPGRAKKCKPPVKLKPFFI